MGQVEDIWLVYILIGFSGVSRCFETPATQGLITEIVPDQMAMRAISVQSTGSKAVGALGGLVGGVVIAASSVPTALFMGAGIFLLGACVMMTMPRGKSERQASGLMGSDVLVEAVRGLLLVIRLYDLLDPLELARGFIRSCHAPASARRISSRVRSLTAPRRSVVRVSVVS